MSRWMAPVFALAVAGCMPQARVEPPVGSPAAAMTPDPA
jgi:hypothetical protein